MLPTGLDYVSNGFGYYREILFNSSSFYDELIPYFQEVIIMIPIILIFSLLIAILLNQKLHGRKVFRAIFFLPVIFKTGYLFTEFVNITCKQRIARNTIIPCSFRSEEY